MLAQHKEVLFLEFTITDHSVLDCFVMRHFKGLLGSFQAMLLQTYGYLQLVGDLVFVVYYELIYNVALV